jgi:hypothetical protein
MVTSLLKTLRRSRHSDAKIGDAGLSAWPVARYGRIAAANPAASKTGKVEHGLREGLRGFLAKMCPTPRRSAGHYLLSSERLQTSVVSMAMFPCVARE